jgi:hypothetical protein
MRNTRPRDTKKGDNGQTVNVDNEQVTGKKD